MFRNRVLVTLSAPSEFNSTQQTHVAKCPKIDKAFCWAEWETVRKREAQDKMSSLSTLLQMLDSSQSTRTVMYLEDFMEMGHLN